MMCSSYADFSGFASASFSFATASWSFGGLACRASCAAWSVAERAGVMWGTLAGDPEASPSAKLALHGRAVLATTSKMNRLHRVCIALLQTKQTAAWVRVDSL